MLMGINRDKRGYVTPSLRGLGDNFPPWTGLKPWVAPPVGTINPETCQPMTQADIDAVRMTGLYTWTKDIQAVNNCPNIPGTTLAQNGMWAGVQQDERTYDWTRNPNLVPDPTGAFAKGTAIAQAIPNGPLPGGVMGVLFDQNNVQARSLRLSQSNRPYLTVQAEAAAGLIVLQGGTVQQAQDAYKNAFLLSNAAPDGIDTAIDYVAQFIKASQNYNGPVIPNITGGGAYMDPGRPAYLFGSPLPDEISSANASAMANARSVATPQELAMWPDPNQLIAGVSARIRDTYGMSLNSFVASGGKAPSATSATSIATADPMAALQQQVTQDPAAQRAVYVTPPPTTFVTSPSPTPTSSATAPSPTPTTNPVMSAAAAHAPQAPVQAPVAASGITDWITANPLLVAGAVLGAFFLMGGRRD